MSVKSCQVIPTVLLALAIFVASCASAPVVNSPAATPSLTSPGKPSASPAVTPSPGAALSLDEALKNGKPTLLALGSPG